jgi:hypothetical protein
MSFTVPEIASLPISPPGKMMGLMIWASVERQIFPYIFAISGRFTLAKSFDEFKIGFPNEF